MSRGTALERAAEAACGILTAAVLVVLYAPVAVIVLFSFVPYRQRTVIWDEATVEWYGKLARNADILGALGHSLVVGVAAVALSLVIATICALYVRSSRAVGTAVLEGMIVLPFLLPPIVTGLSLLIFFREVGLERGLVTVTLGHAAFLLALTYRIVLNRLQAMPRSLVEASRDLGATGWQTFRHVLMPHLASALVVAALLAFTLSFDETLITVFLAGDDMTLPIRLWAMMRVGFTPEINALGTLVMLFSVTATLLLALTLRNRAANNDEE